MMLVPAFPLHIHGTLIPLFFQNNKPLLIVLDNWIYQFINQRNNYIKNCCLQLTKAKKVASLLHNITFVIIIHVYTRTVHITVLSVHTM